MGVRILLLAGSTEASALARALEPDADVICSFAGRTDAPTSPAGRIRVGGFGGTEGLVRYLTEEHIDMVLDATHPFTAQMPGHAHDACRAAGVPRLRVRRPGWREAPGDVWHRVPDYAAAVAELRALGPRRVFLTIGRQNVEPFASMAGTWFLVRSIQDPEWPGPAGATVLLDRGPFTEDRERVLLAAHGIDAVVTKDSGGQAAVAKLAAAREMHVPVVMIDRPPPPPGPLATTVDEALAWCRAQAAQAG